jgi:hypothetical protein
MVAVLVAVLILPCCKAQLPPAHARADTVRLEVGSLLVNGRVYAPHTARVRVHLGEVTTPPVAEWTNELTLGDSAGRPIMRWITRGTQYPPGGATVQWELRQTYDAVTLAPYGYHSTSTTGAWTRLRLDGPRVRGSRHVPGEATEQQVDVTLDRPGFFAGASDLVPLAAGLEAGKVMTAPVWTPAMTRTELRIFTVIGLDTVDVEGSTVVAWKVEERRHADAALLATWWLTEASPYMVYGEVIQPNGQVRRMTEVEIPHRPSGEDRGEIGVNEGSAARPAC